MQHLSAAPGASQHLPGMWKRFNSSELRAAMSDYLRAVMYYPLSIPKVYMLIRGALEPLLALARLAAGVTTRARPL